MTEKINKQKPIINCTMLIQDLDTDNMSIQSLTERSKYLAFGSNLSIKRMQKRCPSARVLNRYIVNNHKLTYGDGNGGRKGVATLLETEHCTVAAVLYEITGKDLLKLDRCEGVAVLKYARKSIILQHEHDDEHVNAFTYLLLNPGKPVLPDYEYWSKIETGLCQFEFDEHLQKHRASKHLKPV